MQQEVPSHVAAGECGRWRGGGGDQCCHAPCLPHCRGRATFLDLLTQVEMEVERLKERGKEVYKLPAGAKVEIGQKRGEVEEEHCQLLDRLLVQRGAARQQYHGRGERIIRYSNTIRIVEAEY